MPLGTGRLALDHVELVRGQVRVRLRDRLRVRLRLRLRVRIKGSWSPMSSANIRVYSATWLGLG